MAEMLYLPSGETVAVFGDKEDCLARLIQERLGSDAERLYRSVCKECLGRADDLQDELDSRNEQITKYLRALREAKRVLEQITESPETMKLYGAVFCAMQKIQMSLMGL